MSVENLAEQVPLKVRTRRQDPIVEKGQPQNCMAPLQLRDSRSKAYAERNAAMILGCKDYLDKLPTYHDKYFLRRSGCGGGSTARGRDTG
jgi:hypothetical protein